ncbi:MAG: UDP-2,3-diacylglucosamine diphosphatase [Pseudomonadota bacterium]
MAETIFIADLHLCESAPDIARRLLALGPRLRQADAVYILGDLVEAWIGDDAPIAPGLQPVLDLLAELSAHGIPVHFQHGNRDFLIGKRLARQVGMVLLPEAVVTPLHGHRIALVHGDQLCTDDKPYQRMRRILRNPIVSFLLRRLPLAARERLASGLRARSRVETQRKNAFIMDINHDAVHGLMTRLGVDVLIHGHTHRPAIHRESSGLRAVLGDWERGAVLIALGAHGLRLERVDDDGTAHVLDQASWPDPLRRNGV